MTLPIKVITYKDPMPNPEGTGMMWRIESTKFIDHDNSSDRKWLSTHCFWAMRNNRKVVTYPESN